MSEIADTQTMERTKTSDSTTLRDAMWIASRDIRASWLSYPASFLIAGFFGLLGTVQFANALSGDGGAFGVGSLDFYLLCIVPAFGTNLLFNRDYYLSLSMKSFDERISFLRSMPVGGRAAISARAICAVLAIAVAAPAFFSVPFVINASLGEDIGVVGYLCFCLFWVGYALVVTGIMYIYGPFAVRWNYWNMVLLGIGFLGFNIAVPVVFRLLLGESLSLTVLGLAGSHGPLVALVPLLVGAATIILCVRKAETGLAGRDIG